MSFGVSTSSNPQTTTNTQTTQSVAGSSAERSPTIFSGGAVNLNMTDEQATRQALDAMSGAITQVLDEQSSLNSGTLSLLSDFNTRQQQAATQQSQDGMGMLSTILANNQTLAENAQSGGATTGMNYSTKIIYAALAVVGILVAVVLFRK